MNPAQGQPKTTLTVCACGTLHLTHGPVTLHFRPEEFIAFGQGIALLVSQFQKMPNAQLPFSHASDEPMCH
jgi:hypothetical protein